MPTFISSATGALLVALVTPGQACSATIDDPLVSATNNDELPNSPICRIHTDVGTWQPYNWRNAYTPLAIGKGFSTHIAGVCSAGKGPWAYTSSNVTVKECEAKCSELNCKCFDYFCSYPESPDCQCPKLPHVTPLPSATKVACVGDSITAGYLSSCGLDYPSQLQRLLGPKYAVTNYGVGGTTLLKRADHPYWNTSAYTRAVESEADIVVIMLGTNDAKSTNWHRYSAEYESDYASLINIFKSLASSPRIHIMTPLPLYKDGRYGMLQTAINTDLPRLVPAVATANALPPPIDLFALFQKHCPIRSGTPGHPPNATDQPCDWIGCGGVDACHPNNEGYSQLAAAVMAVVGPPPPFNVSNTLGSGMVLQRAPQSAVVWGFGAPGVKITTILHGHTYDTTIDANGTWRQVLPPQPAMRVPTNLTFRGSDGGLVVLTDVLFGDVFLCSGQSNMQYTPHSMAGMNNASAEIAAADAFTDIRYFTVGMDIGSDVPLNQLNPNFRHRDPTCAGGKSCRTNWTHASAAALGAQAWDTFSAVCWLFGRDVYRRLNGTVPIGLVSSNWGGTPIQSWQPLASARDCTSKGAKGGNLYNAMIAPYTVGPMALHGVTWYQGESNVGQAAYYTCAFPSMITRWREAFGAPTLWFGFVQIAGYAYSKPYGPHHLPEKDHSHYAGDLRQSQLAALKLPNVGLSTAIDTGDWQNIHPPDKQTVALRLADQAMVQAYKQPSATSVWYPMYFTAALDPPSPLAGETASTVEVTVTVRAHGKPVALTTALPAWAAQSTTLGKGPDLPRNECVTRVAAYGLTFPSDCGYPMIIGSNASGARIALNATASIAGDDLSSIKLTATLPAAMRGTGGFTPSATSYGRASWPMTLFFSLENGLPLLPWLKDGLGIGGEEADVELPHRLPAWAEAMVDEELGKLFDV